MAINEGEILAALGLGIEKGDQMDLGTPVTIGITAWAKDKIRIVRDILLKRGTGALGQSVEPLPIEQNGDQYKITITADDYADFIDQGVNGTIQSWQSPYSFKNIFPSREMIDKLKEWNKTTGRTVPNNEYPKIKTYDQLAFATAINVKKHGIEPSYFMDSAFGLESEQELAEILSITIGRAVDVHFQGVARKYNPKS